MRPIDEPACESQYCERSQLRQFLQLDASLPPSMPAAWMGGDCQPCHLSAITVHAQCHVICCGQKSGDGKAALDKLKRHHGSLRFHAPLSYF
jgi:hypothetical protein